MEMESEMEDAARIQDDYTLRYRMHDFMCISQQWRQAAGDEVVISLIEALPGERGALADWTPAHPSDDTRGWTARHPDGTKISLQATRPESATLEIGDLTAEAEFLLVLESSEHIEGLLLGASSLQRRGKPVDLPHPDLEFRFDSDGWTFAPIFSPIQPVDIHPARDVVRPGETVKLSTPTPGVEIRYTLDGSEPDLTSPLYTGPIPVLGPVTLKARAFRPSLSRLPETLEGTHVTTTAIANFSVQSPLPAVSVPNIKPGLQARELQGDWQDLIFFPEILSGTAPKTVREPFERFHPNANKVINRHLSGYLKVPETGIYTFDLPRETVNSTTEPGYALRLFLGRERLPNGQESGNLNEWLPATTRHAYGTWSVALEAGLHPFELFYTDYRTDARDRWNHPGLRQNLIWDGDTPDVRVTPPGQNNPQPLPATWFFTN
jgi:hypothetical protein